MFLILITLLHKISPGLKYIILLIKLFEKEKKNIIHILTIF